MNHAQKRRPTIAKEWQLAVLKKLHSESSNPTEGQRSAAAAETGLDEKWVKNWFIRQRSKGVARNRKCRPASTESTQPHAATIPTFKLQLCPTPALPGSPQDLSSRRSVSTPIDLGPYLDPNSLAGLGSRSHRPSRSFVNAQATSHPHRSVSAPTYLNNSPQIPTLVPHTTRIPAYSRDPLHNRYPDFSQFFRPDVHDRFRISELSAQLNNHNHHVQLSAGSNMDPHVAMHSQGLFNLPNPLHFGVLSTYCPVTFSMRLADLVGHP